MSNKLAFNSDWLPERERFAAFNELMSRAYAPFDIVERTDGEPFRASLSFERAGRVSIGRLAITPTEFQRSSRLMRDGMDDLGLVLCLQGGAYQPRYGDHRTLKSGEAIMVDGTTPGTIAVSAPSQFWVLKFPRLALSALVPPEMQFGKAKLGGDPTACRLLAGYLEAGRNLSLGLNAQLTELYDEHLVDLIVLALGAQGDARRQAEQRGGGVARRAAILRAIEKYAATPGLSTTSIALLLGITPRYVRMLLEETGRSFSEHVLERRLERAMATLSSAAEGDCRVADIAAACGFNDLSYFNRTFRRRFGVTPSDVRAAIRGPARDR